MPLKIAPKKLMSDLNIEFEKLTFFIKLVTGNNVFSLKITFEKLLSSLKDTQEQFNLYLHIILPSLFFLYYLDFLKYYEN